MNRVPSRLFRLLVVTGFFSSLSLSAQQYHDAAAFGLKGNVKECQVVVTGDDTQPFLKVSFTKDGKLDQLEEESFSSGTGVGRRSDIVRSGDLLTGFRCTYGDKEQHDYRFRYRGDNLIGFYKEIRSGGNAVLYHIYTFSEEGNESFNKGFFGVNGFASEEFESLIERGFKGSGSSSSSSLFFPLLESFVVDAWAYDPIWDTDFYRSLSNDYIIKERDSHGNYTSLVNKEYDLYLESDPKKCISIKRIITYWDDSSKVPVQTSSTSPTSASRPSTSGTRSNSRSTYRYRGGRTRSYSEPWFTIGIDGSLDYYVNTSQTLTTYYDPYYGDYYTEYSEGEDRMAYGAGLFARIGRLDHMFNLVGGARYMFGDMKGILVPVLLNWNLLRGDSAAMYIGGGYEFGITEMYEGTGSVMVQFGISIPHFDCHFYFKPEQTVIGVGATIYL